MAFVSGITGSNLCFIFDMVKMDVKVIKAVVSVRLCGSVG